ncbi:MAG: hypothetical protein ACP5F6_05915 [Microbacter sp.]
METQHYFDQRNPFIVPENYFEDFQAKMEKMVHPVSLPWYRHARSWVAVAAAVMGIFIGSHFLMTTKTVTEKPLTEEESYILSQVDESSLIDYLANMNQNNTSSSTNH